MKSREELESHGQKVINAEKQKDALATIKHAHDKLVKSAKSKVSEEEFEFELKMAFKTYDVNYKEFLRLQTELD